MFSKKFPLSTPVSFWASLMGMRRLAADFVWVQTFQYYGERKAEEYAPGKKKEKKILFPELIGHWQQLIRLDPTFSYVHLVGPTTLAWNLKRYDEAMILIDESIETVKDLKEKLAFTHMHHTDETHPLVLGKYSYFEELLWKLYTLKTVIVYFNQDRFFETIPLLERLVLIKGTPDEIKVILAQIYEEKSENLKALRLWINIFETTKKPDRKERAFMHIQNLKTKLSG
jgi:tetratricopeptide (TPR) repeat protein